MPRELTVLFVCQHGAAKSVLAAELLRQRAGDLDLPVTIEAAGVDPEAAVSARLVELLPDRAAQLRVSRPRRVTQDDVTRASVAITFNVEPEALPGRPEQHLRWDDVPAVSEDPIAARAAIERHLEELVARLRR
jgi:arsenate reductase (thioredoxin)